MTEVCPKTPKYPLFNDKILQREQSAEIYKTLYCRSEEKHKECKRFIVSETIGKCPDFVTPNSFYTVDEIIEKMQKEELL